MLCTLLNQSITKDKRVDNLKEELKTYVQDHINERIRLEELEKYFFYSKFHLCREFKKKTSCTIMTYINNIKLEEAKRELQNEKK